MNRKEFKYKLKTWTLLATGFVSTAFISCRSANHQHSSDKIVESKTFPAPDTLNKVNMQDAYKKGWCRDIIEYVDKTTYKTDTIVLNKDNYRQRMCGAAYRPGKDDVLVKYFVPDLTGATTEQAKKIMALVKLRNDEQMLKINLAHEYKHRDSQKAFIQSCTAEDFARICQHNEIASRCASLVYELEVYKRATKTALYTDKYLDGIFESKYKPFTDAIKAGIIKPFSTDPKEKELLNYMLVKTASDWWIGAEQRVNSHISGQKLRVRIDANKDFIARKTTLKTKKAYNKALDICYTFMYGGELVNMNYFSDDTTSPFGRNRGLEQELQRRLKIATAKQTGKILQPADFMPEEKNLSPLEDVKLRPEVVKFLYQERVKAHITKDIPFELTQMNQQSQ